MDEPKPVQFQAEPAGESGQTPTVAPEQGKQPEYLTRSDLLATLDEWNRQQQSLRKKQENRIKAEVRRMVEAAKEAGQEVTPQLQAAFERKAQQAETTEEEQGAAPEPAQAKAQPTAKAVTKPAAHWVDQAIADIQKQTGVTIVNTDEGADDLASLRQSGDAVGFVARYRELAQQKAEASESNEAHQAQVRMPTATGGGGIGKPTADAYRDEMQAARGDREKLRTIKEKFRKAGLPVDSISLFKRED